MWRAVADGNLDALRDGLDSGVHIDTADGFGRTLLHAAVITGQLESAQLLLDRRADVARADVHGQTALHHAVHLPDVAQLLLERRAPIDAQNRWGNTPFAYATIVCADFSLLETLFQHGASLERALAVDEGRTRHFLRRLAQRRPRCLAVVLALFCLRCVPRDMRRLVAQRVWATRRDAVWDSAKKQRAAGGHL
jgi:hypothetical protein